MKATPIKPSESLSVVTLEPGQLVLDIKKNPRFAGADDPLREYKEFIKSDKVKQLWQTFDREGVKQPIRVHRHGTMYEVVDGDTRAAWAKDRGKSIPAVVSDPIPNQSLLKHRALVNTARNPYNPIALAMFYKNMLTLHDNSATHAARHAGVKVETLRESIAILDLPPSVVDRVRTGKLSAQVAHRLRNMDGAAAFKKDPKSAAGQKFSKLCDLLGQHSANVTVANFAEAWNNVVTMTNHASKKTTTKQKDKKAKEPANKKPEKTKNKQRAKEDAQTRPNTEELLTVLPTEDSVLDACVFHARRIVKAVDAKRMNDVPHVVDIIVNMGAALGWACPLEIREVLKSAKGKELYEADVAAQLNREFVNEVVATAAWQMRADAGRKVKHDMIGNDAEWAAMMRTCSAPSDVVASINACFA